MKTYFPFKAKFSLGDLLIPESFEGEARFDQERSLIWGRVERKCANDTRQHFLYGCQFHYNTQNNRFICGMVPMEESYYDQDLSSLISHPVSDDATYFIMDSLGEMDDPAFPLPATGFKFPDKARFRGSQQLLNTYFCSQGKGRGYGMNPSPEHIATEFLIRMRDQDGVLDQVTIERQTT
jgi:hypothetical protein